MNERVKKALARLIELRGKIEAVEGKEMSDASFVSRFLPFSSTVWSRVNGGSYQGNLETVARQMETAADEMDDRLEAIAKRAERSRGFLATRLAQAVLVAHRRARDDGNSCRIVVVIAPTGAGKTTIGRHIENRLGAVYVEGRQSWLSSYRSFCADVAEAAGMPIRAREFDERTAERQMLAALGTRHGTLVIDEANTLGATTANAIKLIANNTSYTLVVASVPEAWDRFTAAATTEVRQVLNRCQAVIRFPEIPAKDAEMFLCDGFAGDRKAACKRLAEAANAFGAYKMMRRVCDVLDDIPNAGMDDLEKAVQQVRLTDAPA